MAFVPVKAHDFYWRPGHTTSTGAGIDGSWMYSNYVSHLGSMASVIESAYHHKSYTYFNMTRKNGRQETWCSANPATIELLRNFKSNFKSKGVTKTMFQDVRKYIAENKDTIYTILFVAVLDQLFFEGAFREKLKTMTDSFLNKKSQAATTGS